MINEVLMDNSFLFGVDWATTSDITVYAPLVLDKYGYKLAGKYVLIKNSHQDVSLDEPFKPYEPCS